MNSVKVSYAVSQLRAAATILRDERLSKEAYEVDRLAGLVEVIQAARNKGQDRCS